MHIKIRADILNAALQAAATSGDPEFRSYTMYPRAEYNSRTFSQLCREVPEIVALFLEGDPEMELERSPAEKFFCINPPGKWVQLRKLVGPGSFTLYGPEFRDSEEALAIALPPFLEELERQQDAWYELYKEQTGSHDVRMIFTPTDKKQRDGLHLFPNHPEDENK